MMTASEELGLIRPKVALSVARLRRDGRSTMEAYEAFGQQIGRSARWVRKVIGRDETAGVRLRDAVSIQAAYERLCARIDAASGAIEADTIQRRETRHAARSSAAAAGTRDPRLAAGVGASVDVTEERS